MPSVPAPQVFALALQHHQAGRLAEAEALYRQILAAHPNDPEVHNNLGNVLRKRGQLREAVAAYRRALQLQPDLATTHYNLGIVLAEQGQLGEAIEAYRHALALQPDYPKASNNLGIALAKRGQFEEAVIAYRRALQLQPDFVSAHYNLGNALQDHGQFGEATACYERAVALDPRFPSAQFNMGVTWWLQGRFPEAEICYRRAIDCRADFADAHLGLSTLLLLLGRYEEGWREYEWRWRSSAYAHRVRHFSAPQWDGKPIPGQTLLIHAEQGFGDTLLFARYLPLVRAQSRAARLILECQPALVPLLQQLQSAGIHIVPRAASDESLPPFDLHLPLLSTPHVIQYFTPVTSSTPYLHADPALRTAWRERLAGSTGLRVGLAWAGNPLQDDDRRRSIAQEKLAPLLRVPGIRFVSLQVEPRTPLPPPLATTGVSDFCTKITNFSDSSALMAELDLIITVDTATAHLAGALGLPVWVLVPFVPYWPYGVSGETTPWYPTMRLFRQTTTGNWEEVLERVASALSDHVASSIP